MNNFTTNHYKTLVAGFCLVIMATQASAQKLYNSYYREISVDLFRPLLPANGAVILYRQHIGKVNAKKWVTQDAIRGMVSLYSGKIYDTTVIPSFTMTDTLELLTTIGNKQGIGVYGGWERQFVKRRTRYYYGADLGFIFQKSHTDGETSKRVAGSVVSVIPSKWESKNFIPQVSGFVGMNYFISRHLSIGLEVSMALAVDISRSKLLNAQGQVSEDENTVIDMGRNNSMPMVYVGWHFGKTPAAPDVPVE